MVRLFSPQPDRVTDHVLGGLTQRLEVPLDDAVSARVVPPDPPDVKRLHVAPHEFLPIVKGTKRFLSKQNGSLQHLHHKRGCSLGKISQHNFTNRCMRIGCIAIALIIITTQSSSSSNSRRRPDQRSAR